MIVVLLSTFPDVEAARTAVRTLVEERLVACGNILPGVESIYRWQGAVETSAADAEALLRAALIQLKPSQAAAEVARATGLDRKALYARALELK